MKFRDSIQLSFDFVQDHDLTTSIDNLFTENDLVRFGKDRKGWYENAISHTKSSDLGIENPFFGNDVSEIYLDYGKDWIDEMM